MIFVVISWDCDCDSMGDFDGIYPLVNIQKTIEPGHRDFP